MVHSSIRRHLPILLALVALFFWLFSRFFLHPLYIAESDLYENGLPIFLSPIWKWSSYEFSGLPVLADPQNFNFYPPYIVLGELLHSWTAVVVSAPLLAACFTYAYVFSLTRARTAAMFSALAYGLSEEMLERLRHLNHVHVIAWLPLIALAVDRVRHLDRDGDLAWSADRRWIAIGAFAVGSCILAGHPQPALYAMYCVGLYALVGLLVDRSPWRQWASTAVLFAVGILLSAIKALPLAEARNYVVRGEGLTFERFVGPSLSGPQMFTFVFPTILHEPITELPTYVGVATLLLAMIGVARIRSNWRIAFWLVMSIIGVSLALGNATRAVDVAYYVPLYTWFRNLSRHLFLFAFGSSVLAGYGVAALQARQVSMRKLRIASAILLAFMILGAFLIWRFPAAFPLETVLGQRGSGPLSFLSAGIWIQFIVLIAVVAIVAWILAAPSQLALSILLLLLVADLLNALPYDIKRDGIDIFAIPAEAAKPSVHALAIGRALEATQGRALAAGGTQVDDVLPATFARVWRIPIAGGYGAMILDRISRMANMGTNGEIRPTVLSDADTVLDLLAVRYVMVNDDDLADPVRQQWLRGSSRWREAMHFNTSRETDRGKDEDIAGETAVTVFENERALPRAWFVNTVTFASDDDAIRAIQEGKLPAGSGFDPRSQALMDRSEHPPTSRFTPGESQARVMRIGDGDILLATTSEGTGLMVLSENAYPGWRARIDGTETPIYRADVALQAVVVPAGVHRVEFTMQSRSLRTGMIVSAVAAIVIGVLLIV
jgi:hypothetical protein